MSGTAIRALAGLAAGLLFGTGLVLSGMANPAKVLAFLDVAGGWDPSLAFVMAGAIAVALPGFAILPRRQAPLLGGRFELPTRRDIDAKLLGGALLFGIGWGISGFCPGPAFTALSFGETGTLLFVPAMLAGMWIGAWLRDRPALTPAEASR